MSKHPNLILKRGMITDDTDSFVFRQNAAQVEPDKDPQDTVHLQPVDHINTEQPVLDFALTGNPDF